MPVTIEATNLEDILKAYSALTGKGLAQITRAHARLACVQLANRTQAFTTGPSDGPAALDRQTKTVSFDIKKVIKDKESLRERFEKSVQDEKIRDRLVKVLNAGRYDILAKIMVNIGMIHSESDFIKIAGVSSAKTAHTQHINRKSGRTNSPPGKVYLSTGELESYIEEVSKRIGYTKSGWAECARRIGGLSSDGARGIPSFAKRQRGNNWNVDDNGANIDNPNFVMTNTTPWIRRLLSVNDEKDAMRIARDKMIKSMQRAIKEAKRGESAAKKSIAKEVADAQ